MVQCAQQGGDASACLSLNTTPVTLCRFPILPHALFTANAHPISSEPQEELKNMTPVLQLSRSRLRASDLLKVTAKEKCDILF